MAGGDDAIVLIPIVLICTVSHICRKKCRYSRYRTKAKFHAAAAQRDCPLSKAPACVAESTLQAMLR